MSSKTQNTLACFAHLAAFSKYFIPFGNFIIPLLIWVSQEKDSFSAEQSKRSLNFQMSIFLYFSFLLTVGIAGLLFFGISLASIPEFYFSEDSFYFNPTPEYWLSPFFIFLAAVLILALGLFLFHLVCVIQAAVQTAEGKAFKYPLCIPFLKPVNVSEEKLNNEMA